MDVRKRLIRVIIIIRFVNIRYWIIVVIFIEKFFIGI